MKKIFSLLLCVTMVFSTIATVAFASTPMFSGTVDKTTVNIDDVVTVTLDGRTATAVDGLQAVIDFDKNVFECTAINLGYTQISSMFQYGGQCASVSDANNLSKVTFGWAAGEQAIANPCPAFVTIKFKAKAASAGAVFTLRQESTSTTSPADEYADMKTGVTLGTVVVKGNEPEAPVVRDNPTVVGLDKTWTVDIDSDYVTASDTLTATLYDTTNTSDTQIVTLSMGNNVVEGGAAWSFTLKATFENAAKINDIALRVSK